MPLPHWWFAGQLLSEEKVFSFSALVQKTIQLQEKTFTQVRRSILSSQIYYKITMLLLVSWLVNICVVSGKRIIYFKFNKLKFLIKLIIWYNIKDVTIFLLIKLSIKYLINK